MGFLREMLKEEREKIRKIEGVFWYFFARRNPTFFTDPDKCLSPNHLWNGYPQWSNSLTNFCGFSGASHSEAERIAELEKDVNTERLDKQRHEEAAKSLQERLDKVKSELDALRKDQVIKHA